MLSDDELVRLVKACAGRRWYDRRDEVVIRLLLDTGIRVAELTSLTRDNLHLDTGAAVVLGKGSKIGPVNYGAARTARALDRWMHERRQHRWSHRVDGISAADRAAIDAAVEAFDVSDWASLNDHERDLTRRSTRLPRSPRLSGARPRRSTERWTSRCSYRSRSATSFFSSRTSSLRSDEVSCND